MENIKRGNKSQMNLHDTPKIHRRNKIYNGKTYKTFIIDYENLTGNSSCKCIMKFTEDVILKTETFCQPINIILQRQL
jgi:hypothetical protein